MNKNFGDTNVLKNINLTVNKGEKLVVIGPSGSGKSTLIRCMNYLEEPTLGKVTVDGYDLKFKKAYLKFVNIQQWFFNNLIYIHI